MEGKRHKEHMDDYDNLRYFKVIAKKIREKIANEMIKD